MSERILSDYDFLDLWRDMDGGEECPNARRVSDIVKDLLEHWEHADFTLAERRKDLSEIIVALNTFSANEALIGCALKDIWVVNINGRDTGEHYDTEQKAINAGYKATRNSSDHYDVRKLYA